MACAHSITKHLQIAALYVLNHGNIHPDEIPNFEPNERKLRDTYRYCVLRFRCTMCKEEMYYQILTSGSHYVSHIIARHLPFLSEKTNRHRVMEKAKEYARNWARIKYYDFTNIIIDKQILYYWLQLCV
jgi:hypothetical protein